MKSFSAEKILRLINELHSEFTEIAKELAGPVTDTNASTRIAVLQALKDISDTQAKSSSILQEIISSENTQIQKHITDTEAKLMSLIKTLYSDAPASSFADMAKKTPPKTMTPAPPVLVVGSGLKQPVMAKLPDTKFTVCKNINIPAFPIRTAAECHKYKGYWCWNADDNRFWISINGLAVPGYVTKVHAANACPIKFMEYDQQKKQNTDKINNYYKPPELFPGSSDIRHLTDRLRYHNDTDRYNNDQFIISVSDADHVAEDISLLTDKNARLVCDVSSHYMMLGYLVRSLYK